MKVWFGMVEYGSNTGVGNNAADEAADFGRRRVDFPVIDARRNFSGVCGRWYPLILVLHPFLIAISRAVVNHVGGDGTAPDPLIWSAGALPKRRRNAHAVRDRAFLHGLVMVKGSPLMQHLSLLRMLGLGHTQSGSRLDGLLS